METPANEKLWNANYMKLWVANFMLFFSFMLLMPLLPIYLSDTFATDKQTIGIVLSGYTITALLVRPFSGFVVDSFPRKTVLLVCYFLFFIFFAGYFIGGSLVLFAVIRTLHGAPFGATTVANSTVVIDVLPASRRAEGIGRLLRLPEPPQVVVLDDAYQHRYVRPGFSVLLTAASRPYTADHLLPWGRLRERPHAARRAQAVVVTKCAPGQRPPVPVGPGQSLFYSRIAYLPLQPWDGQQGEAKATGVEGQTLLLLTAIAHPEPLRDHLLLRGAARVESLAFPDHHAFGPRDVERIHSAFARLRPDRVVTTQKDAMRLQAVEPQLRPDFLARLCVQPIGVEIEPAGTSQRTFNQTILQYVESHTANR